MNLFFNDLIRVNFYIGEHVSFFRKVEGD